MRCGGLFGPNDLPWLGLGMIWLTYIEIKVMFYGGLQANYQDPLKHQLPG